jgi:hypothetical protein
MSCESVTFPSSHVQECNVLEEAYKKYTLEVATAGTRADEV